jgi:hypothetical protein
MKRVNIAWCAIVCAACCLAPPYGLAGQAEEDAAIRKNAEDYVAAYNNHDAQAVAAMWSPDAVYMDPSTGEAAVGREEIERYSPALSPT